MGEIINRKENDINGVSKVSWGFSKIIRGLVVQLQSFLGSRELNVTESGRLKFLRFQSPVPANKRGK